MKLVIEAPRDPGYPVHTLRLRVRQYEIDSFGHVNNAVYLNYLEQAAIEHAAALGFSHERLRSLGGLWVVRHHEIEYLAAAVEGDDLAILTWLESISGVRAVRCYEIRNTSTEKRLIVARTLWVWVDATTGRPRPHPPEIARELACLIGHATVEPAS